MRFAPQAELESTPHLIVDGASTAFTVLNLSHWPHSGTPRELKADLSAEIAFRYLDRPEFHVDVDCVSNDHFDEDGLVSMLTVLSPDYALDNRELLIEIARAGDFGTYSLREAARIAFALSTYADKRYSPLGGELFNRPYSELAAGLYQNLLAILPDIIENPDRYQQWWQEEEAFLDASEEAVSDGAIQIEQIPEIDLAVVTIPEKRPELLFEKCFHRFTQTRSAPCHQMAINNATDCMRILMVRGKRYELHYRYESWVQYVSKRPMSRVDLGPLAEQLSKQEKGDGEWEFDGVRMITPRLHLVGAEESQISPGDFRRQLESFLHSAPPAWDPYDRFIGQALKFPLTLG